jgi:predicted GNAT family acetyltransferase
MLEVVDRPDASRYEVLLDGESVGVCNYRITDEGVLLPHVEVRPDLNGRGVGSTLARGALDDLRRRGLAVVPYCPFIIDFIKRNPEYQDLVRAH